MSTTETLQTSHTPSLWLPAIILVIWGMLIATLASQGAFLDPGPLPLRVVAAALLPPALFFVAWRTSSTIRRWVTDLDFALVTGIQTFRVIGVVFLILLVMGRLPAVFAIPGGIGDIAVGMIAVAATISVARQSNGWERSVRLLIWTGLLDFAVVFAAAALSSPGMPLQLAHAPAPVIMQSLPMVMIPAFGVPAFIIGHMIAWMKLTRA
ncbi:MAG: hypothetical protein ABI459_01075 [Deltaproteobacteria bacterium]